MNMGSVGDFPSSALGDGFGHTHVGIYTVSYAAGGELVPRPRKSIRDV